ncbi:MAG: carbamoyltransferase [Gammaproteobacteria bacterium]
MRILGVSAFYHDSAAALVVDGKILAAAQEERFTRRKHDADFPRHAIRYCLEAGGVRPADLDYVAFYDKPFLKFERLLETYLAFAPRGFRSFRMAIPLWLREKLFQKRLLQQELAKLDPAVDWGPRLLFSEHHLSHAASAFFPSPFEEAVILTMDGVGEWATTSVAIGNASSLEIRKEIHFPHSLGLLYSAFTYYTGFKVNSGEYKVMGLAPYGDARYADVILEHLVDLKDDGSFRLHMDYFDYCTGLTMTNRRFDALFGGPPRDPEAPLEQRHMDLAASIQAVTEEVVLRMTRALRREYDSPNLCLAGGVALNCVANGKVARDGQYANLWIQPAAGDAGGAVGAALIACHGFARCPRQPAGDGDAMHGAYLGPEYSQTEIERRLRDVGARFHTFDPQETLRRAAAAIADGKAVGWFQGRMEFGPRALGARSILGDARSPTMQKLLNLKVKYRESFRPFAPAVLAEDVSEWFDLAGASPYMLLVADVRDSRRIATSAEEQHLFGIERLNVARSEIPAVTHVDNSARIQTVHPQTNPRFHALISRFKEITGCPVVVNTSFNVRGEPIVCSPEDAFRCFMGTEIEVLCIGDSLCLKEEQAPGLQRDYKAAFAPD